MDVCINAASLSRVAIYVIDEAKFAEPKVGESKCKAPGYAECVDVVFLHRQSKRFRQIRNSSKMTTITNR